jgi:hypothetical protein
MPDYCQVNENVRHSRISGHYWALHCGRPDVEPGWCREGSRAGHSLGHIKFYWAGSVGSRPVGVPFEVAKNYPKANAGIGCVTNDIPLRERQEEYARRYNEKIYAYITQKR